MMRKASLLSISLVSLFFFTTSALAEELIKVNVQVDEKSAAAIGYIVEGKSFGGMGKSYLGTGPKNKKYIFGFRKNSVMSHDIRCGELTLKQNANVRLELKGDKCVCKVI